jgi:hypothetical protein
MLTKYADFLGLRAVPTRVSSDIPPQAREDGLDEQTPLIGSGSLMREASIHAKQAGEKGISARNIRKVTEVRL